MKRRAKTDLASSSNCASPPSTKVVKTSEGDIVRRTNKQNIQEDSVEDDIFITSEDLTALEKLDVRARQVYDFAYSKLGYDQTTLKVDSAHAEFFSKALDPSVNLILLLGIAGAGKSKILTILRNYLIHVINEDVKKSPEYYESKLKENFPPGGGRRPKLKEFGSRVVLTTATTGTAAISIRGAVTFHSIFPGVGDLQKGRKYDCLKNIPQTTIDSIKMCRFLSTDEISMLHPITFQNADMIFRTVKREPKKMFGGVKVIWSGDFRQLKPIFDENDGFRMTCKSVDTYPFIFDTPEWKAVEGSIHLVEFMKSFRQDSPEAAEFVSMLYNVRMANLTPRVLELVKSRIMTFEAFEEELCNSLGKNADEIEITPLFRRKIDVNAHDMMRLLRLPPPEYCYISSFIYTYSTASDIQDQLLGFDTDPQTGIQTYDVHLGNRLDVMFDHESLRCSIDERNGIPNNFSSSGETFLGHYHDRGVMKSEAIIRMAQKSNTFKSAGVITKLRRGAKVRLTRNVSVPDQLANQSQGYIVDFMSIRKFMDFKSSKRLPSGAFLNLTNHIQMNVRKDKRKKASEMTPEQIAQVAKEEAANALEDETEEFEYRVFYGAMDTRTNRNSNQPVEKFPLVKFAHNRYMLVTPIVTEVEVISDAKQRANKSAMNDYVAQAVSGQNSQSARYGQSGKKISELSATEHFNAVRSAMNTASQYESTGRKLKVLALIMPMDLAWAQTIHSVQGLTMQYVWLGALNSMEENMFYVVLSRVKLLKFIAWATDPSKMIKSNPRVEDLERRMRMIKSLMGSMSI